MQQNLARCIVLSISFFYIVNQKITNKIYILQNKCTVKLDRAKMYEQYECSSKKIQKRHSLTLEFKQNGTHLKGESVHNFATYTTISAQQWNQM